MCLLLYVASVASECFKSRLRCWEARGKQERVRGVGPRVGARNTSACGRCPDGAGPRVDARRRTAATGIRPDVRALAVPYIYMNIKFSIKRINIHTNRISNDIKYSMVSILRGKMTWKHQET
jgi:hypothetical protein